MEPSTIEVCGLQGRAAVANGQYHKLSRRQHGRAVYEQHVDDGKPSGRTGPAYILYDGGDEVSAPPAWIVEVPGDPGKAYAYAEGDALHVSRATDWMVWFCPVKLSIEDGQDRWYPASDFDDFCVQQPVEGLNRTFTDRSGEASTSLDQINDSIESLEDSVRNLDTPPLERTLIRLHSELLKLEEVLDEVSLSSLTDETPLRDRKRQYIARVVAMQDVVDAQLRSLAAARAKAPDARKSRQASSGGSHGGGGGVRLEPVEPELEPEPEPERLIRTPSKTSTMLDNELEAIGLEIKTLDERSVALLRKCDDAMREHAQGYASSRTNLTSSSSALGRLLLELEDKATIRLEAVAISDDARYRGKNHQHNMLSKTLRELHGRLESGKASLDEVLSQPDPATTLQLAVPSSQLPPPRVAGNHAAWSAATVNAVLQRTSTVRNSMSADATPALAWRNDDISESVTPRSPDQRRLEGLYGIDPEDFAPEFNFDFTEMSADDDGEHMRGGQPYFRPCGWKRFALNVETKYTLDCFSVKDLKAVLLEVGHRQTTAGLERRDLVRLAREAGGDELSQRWLGDTNSPGEWVNAYHGTTPNAAPMIARAGLRRGRSANSDDGGDGVARRNGAVFGAGVYCTPRVEEAEMYSEPIEVSADVDGVVSTKFYCVVFQCRVRGPPCASYAEAEHERGFFNVGLSTEQGAGSWAKDYWVVPRQEDVRPYAVLLKEV